MALKLICVIMKTILFTLSIFISTALFSQNENIPEKIIDFRTIERNKKNVTFFKNDGKSLGNIEDNSIDFIWSYDVFVHIDKKTQFDYFLEFKRVLKTNGKCIIHHTIGDETKSVEPGWRSKISRSDFNNMLREAELELNYQTQSWGKKDEFNCKLFNDSISVITKI